MNKKVGIGLAVGLLVAVIIIVTQVGNQEEGVIKIGAILPLTGDGAQYGKAAQRGIELAAKNINEQSGINDKKIIIVFEDTQGNPKTGVTAIQKMILKDKVNVVIGDLFSSVTLAVAPIMNQKNIVLLSPASSSPKITQAGDYVFRNCPSDVYEGGVMANYASSQLKIKKVAILYVNNDYGIGIKKIFRETFTANSGQVVAEESFGQDATDFRNQLVKIDSFQPEGIYLIGHKEMGLVLKQARELGIKCQFLSTVMFEDPTILEIAKDAAEGVIYSASAFDVKSEQPIIKKFVDSYREEYNADPDVFSALSYDSVAILKKAMSGNSGSTQEIKEALYAIKDFDCVMGTISFDSNGDVKIAPVIKQVKNGQFSPIN